MVILDLYVLACVFVAAGKEMFLLGGQFLYFTAMLRIEEGAFAQELR